MIRNRREGANHAFGEGENLVLLTGEALHAGVVLQRRGVAELVNGLPEGESSRDGAG